MDAHLLDVARVWETTPGYGGGTTPFLETLWAAIDAAVSLADCDVYAYRPGGGGSGAGGESADPFGEAGSLWSLNFFFYDRRAKRIVYLGARGLSKAAAGGRAASSSGLTGVGGGGGGGGGGRGGGGGGLPATRARPPAPPATTRTTRMGAGRVARARPGTAAAGTRAAAGVGVVRRVGRVGVGMMVMREIAAAAAARAAEAHPVRSPSRRGTAWRASLTTCKLENTHAHAHTRGVGGSPQRGERTRGGPQTSETRSPCFSLFPIAFTCPRPSSPTPPPTPARSGRGTRPRTGSYGRAGRRPGGPGRNPPGAGPPHMLQQ